MKPNHLAIIGGILAIVSLALPWWTMSVSFTNRTGTPIDVSVYPYSVQVNGKPVNLSVQELMFGWAALAFTVIGGVAGIIAGVKPGSRRMKGYYGRRFNIGILGLLSVILFAVVLQSELDGTLGLSSVMLFGSGQLYFTEYGINANANYFSYLSFGFWLALAAAITLFFAFRNKPAENAVVPRQT